jgi:hypothetical protein
LERTIAQGRLSGRTIVPGNLVFSVAQPEHEPDIRGLLRENEMDGWVRLSFEREPDAFAADFGLSRSHAFIIARDQETGEAVGICERSVRDAFVDGEIRPLPYLGSLRVAPAHRHRIRVLRGGFAAVRSLLHQPADLPYALTAIAAGNRTAQRVLGAGLPGLPSYWPAGELSTFAMRTARASTPLRGEPAVAADLPAIAVLLQRVYRRFQFAPVWRLNDLQRLLSGGGLRIDHFLVVRRGPGVRACLAVWDQSGAKQTIIRGYAPWLASIRPVVNLATPFTAMPRLPPVGSPLCQVYLSHVAVEDDDPALFRSLLAAGLAQAHRRGFEVALAGFASGHPFCTIVKLRRPVTYRSLLFLVHWQENAPAAKSISPQMPYPEIALM